VNPGAGDPEWYVLDVGPRSVSVVGGSLAGVARGAATLTQLIATSPAQSEGVRRLGPVHVLDAPTFAWRGLTLDVARRFLEIADLQRLIDLLALYRLNVLHLHLTDNEGWRVQPGRPPTRPTDDTGDRFYTDEALRALDRYAASRFVTVVPEIDTPGHAAALVRLRPELDTGRNVRNLELLPGRPQATAWLDAERSSAIDVVGEVIERMADVFSGSFVHIGGDEPNDMPPVLYEHFVRQARSIVESAGRRPIGWQETARAGVRAGDVIQYWIDSSETDGGGARPAAASFPPAVERAVRDANRAAADDVRRALSASALLVLSPTSATYLDVPYAEPSSDPEQEPIRRRLGMPFLPPSTIEEFWDGDPRVALPALNLERDVAGVSAALWCETVRDFDDATFLLLPRLAGIADHAWGGWRAFTWSDHRSRLRFHADLWDALGLRWFRSSIVDWTGP
jgi:hexosaminidase